MTTTELPTDLEIDEDDGYEEPENAVLRREPGLQAIHYPDSGSHPDQRPCPSWCWIGQHEEYEHEVNSRHPLDAEQRLDARPSIVASLYRANLSQPGVSGAGSSRPRPSNLVSSRSGRQLLSSTWRCADTKAGDSSTTTSCCASRSPTGASWSPRSTT